MAESCGTKSWWEDFDYETLTARYGQLEHIIIQVDFLKQYVRYPRVEYSIPAASKKGTGHWGFADILAFRQKEIWEIKPDDENGLNDGLAAAESAHYVGFALSSCGDGWKPGRSYRTKEGNGVVYTFFDGQDKVQLCAKQASAGSVLYFWEVNDKRVPRRAWDAKYRTRVLNDIKITYFKSPADARPVAGGNQPGAVSPLKFKKPVIQDNGLISEFVALKDQFATAIRSTLSQGIPDGCAIAILVPSRIFQAGIDAARLNRTLQLLQVRSKRNVGSDVLSITEALESLGRIVIPTVAIAAAAAALVAAVLVAVEAVPVGGIIAIVLAVTESSVAPAAATAAEGAIVGGFAESLRLFLLGREALAIGATLVVFAIPSLSQAKERRITSIALASPMYRILTPEELRATRLAQPAPEIASSSIADALLFREPLPGRNTDWIIVGIAQT
ncbi:hypothetical protein PQQ75_15915 [Paraburkholderia aspalathi]|uniref:hypothetical protein n=1 Tax=Paraburkholderia aspalathi TaxID=1324617 RepID=UPI0038BD4B38